MEEIKKMAIKEFREKGYLQEVNRRFFHPLGLALVVILDDDGNERLGGVWDGRLDEDGYIYDIKNQDKEKVQGMKEKAFFVEGEIQKRKYYRSKHLGFITEPIFDAGSDLDGGVKEE